MAPKLTLVKLIWELLYILIAYISVQICYLLIVVSTLHLYAICDVNDVSYLTGVRLSVA